MRYVGLDDSHVYIKCNHCKKIHAYNKEEYEETSDKKCAECGAKFRFVWFYSQGLSRIRSYIPFLVMTVLTFLIIFIIYIPFFKKYYYFNKAVTALNPIVASILIPIFCSLITIVPTVYFGNPNKRLIDNIRGNVLQILGIVIEFVALIFILNIIIGIQYCALKITNPDTGEIQQYYGYAIDKSASGNGRLFDSQGNLIYIGEFKNNMYDGYGKNYQKIDNFHNTDVTKTYQCIYEGDFKEGLPDGQGREYRYDAEYDFEKENDISPYLYYDGEFKAGKYCGFGTLYGVKEKYNGFFFDGIYNGYGSKWIKDSDSELTYKLEGIFGAGKKYRADGSIYFDGEYKNSNAVSGTIYYMDGNPKYEGGFNGNNYDGEGKLYWENGEVRYDGSWSNDKREGQGISYREDGTVEYEEYWKEDQYSGYGKLYYKDGKTVQYEGRYLKGYANGNGTSYSRGGLIEYEGHWQSGKWNGKGKWNWENGNLYYDGDFVDGKPHGTGTSYWDDRTIQYDGQWSEGEYSGEETQYDIEGKVLHKGNFVNGEFVVDDSKSD